MSRFGFCVDFGKAELSSDFIARCYSIIGRVNPKPITINDEGRGPCKFIQMSCKMLEGKVFRCEFHFEDYSIRSFVPIDWMTDDDMQFLQWADDRGEPVEVE